MSLAKDDVRKLIDIYICAWTTQDPDLILTIFTPSATYLDGPTAIAEWEARFDDLVKAHRKRMRAVAILEFDGDRIASLREFWTSERLSS